MHFSTKPKAFVLRASGRSVIILLTKQADFNPFVALHRYALKKHKDVKLISYAREESQV